MGTELIRPYQLGGPRLRCWGSDTRHGVYTSLELWYEPFWRTRAIKWLSPGCSAARLRYKRASLLLFPFRPKQTQGGRDLEIVLFINKQICTDGIFPRTLMHGVRRKWFASSCSSAWPHCKRAPPLHPFRHKLKAAMALKLQCPSWEICSSVSKYALMGFSSIL